MPNINTQIKDHIKPFTGAIKLSELIDANYNLLWTIERLGIGFGFGNETIEEVCKKRGINTNTFLLICNIYTFNGYIPSADTLKTTELAYIVKYLHQSHSYYLNTAIKKLAEDLEAIILECNDKYKLIIRQFFTGYTEEIKKHFEYEEDVVFPYVNSILEHSQQGGFNILQYEENHSNIQEKLNDLKNIIMKYMPYQCSSSSICQLLFSLYRLEEDLQKHTALEEDILIPMINNIEKTMQQ